MCGLAGYIGSSPDILKLKVLALYNKTRGTDGFGIVVNNRRYPFVNTNADSKVALENEGFPATEIISPIVMMHTRQASVGAKTVDNVHPFEYKNKKDELLGFFSMNGTVYNYTEMLKKRGIAETFTNDSKALGFMLFVDNFKPNIMSEYQGGGAFAYYSVKENHLYLWKGAAGDVEERPLYYMITSNGVYYSSLKDSLMFIRDTKEEVIHLVPNNTLLKFSVEGLVEYEKIERSAQLKYSATSYGNSTSAYHNSSQRTTSVNNISNVEHIVYKDIFQGGVESIFGPTKIAGLYYYNRKLANGVYYQNESTGKKQFVSISEVVEKLVSSRPSGYFYLNVLGKNDLEVVSIILSNKIKDPDVKFYLFGIELVGIPNFITFLEDIEKAVATKEIESYSVHALPWISKKYNIINYIPFNLVENAMMDNSSHSPITVRRAIANKVISDNGLMVNEIETFEVFNLRFKLNRSTTQIYYYHIESLADDVNVLPLSYTKPLKYSLSFSKDTPFTGILQCEELVKDIQSNYRRIVSNISSKKKVILKKIVFEDIMDKFKIFHNVINNVGYIKIDGDNDIIPVQEFSLKPVKQMHTSGNFEYGNKCLLMGVIFDYLTHSFYNVEYTIKTDKETVKKIRPNIHPYLLKYSEDGETFTELVQICSEKTNVLINSISNTFITLKGVTDTNKLNLVIITHLVILYVVDYFAYGENEKLLQDIRMTMFNLNATTNFKSCLSDLLKAKKESSKKGKHSTSQKHLKFPNTEDIEIEDSFAWNYSFLDLNLDFPHLNKIRRRENDSSLLPVVHIDYSDVSCIPQRWENADLDLSNLTWVKNRESFCLGEIVLAKLAFPLNTSVSFYDNFDGKEIDVKGGEFNFLNATPTEINNYVFEKDVNLVVSFAILDETNDLTLEITAFELLSGNYLEYSPEISLTVNGKAEILMSDKYYKTFNDYVYRLYILLNKLRDLSKLVTDEIGDRVSFEISNWENNKSRNLNFYTSDLVDISVNFIQLSDQRDDETLTLFKFRNGQVQKNKILKLNSHNG